MSEIQKMSGSGWRWGWLSVSAEQMPRALDHKIYQDHTMYLVHKMDLDSL